MPTIKELQEALLTNDGDAHNIQTSLGAGDSAGGAGFGCERRGVSALTTMLIFGLNSDSYWTQRAATAASC